jgi:hypothetical protein
MMQNPILSRHVSSACTSVSFSFLSYIVRYSILKFPDHGLNNALGALVVFVDTLGHPVEARSDGTNRKIIEFQPGQRYLATAGQSPPSEFD